LVILISFNLSIEAIKAFFSYFVIFDFSNHINNYQSFDAESIIDVFFMFEVIKYFVFVDAIFIVFVFKVVIW
jgi:hypothetical protein